MPLYCGVNSVKHKIKGLYTGVGGVKKELTEMWAAENGVKKLVYQVVKGSPIGDLPVGSIVKINENGNPVNYLIVHQGLPSSMYDASCNGTWLLRQDIAEKRIWDAGSVNKLESSNIHAYLNGTWLNRYDAEIRDIIKQAKIPYRRGGGKGTDLSGSDGLPCKAFLLSMREVGFTTEGYTFPMDGYALQYFILGNTNAALKKRIAYLNGTAISWYSRSPMTRETKFMLIIGDSGHSGSSISTNRQGIRPAVILPQSTLVDDLGNIVA